MAQLQPPSTTTNYHQGSSLRKRSPMAQLQPAQHHREAYHQDNGSSHILASYYHP